MDWLEALSKFLPVDEIYKDALKPATREFGQALGSSVKAGRLLLAPIDYLAAQSDRLQRYFKRISEKVNEADMIPVHPQIGGPVLDALRYVDDSGLISEMYLNLLARAMDKQRVSEAHPAFVEVIRQLSPDEALILYRLKRMRYAYVIRNRIMGDEDSPPYKKFGEIEETIIENEFPTAELNFPDNFALYAEHLSHLNILVTRPVAYKKSSDASEGDDVRIELRFTKFGSLFSEACVPDNLPLHSV